MLCLLRPTGLRAGLLGCVLALLPVAGARAQCPEEVPNFSASNAGCSSVVLSWDRAANAESYQVWRGTTPNFASAQQLVAVPQWGPSAYQDFAAGANIVYYYWVRGRNQVSTCTSGSGPFAGPVSGSRLGVPSAPTGLNVTAVSCGTLRLTWGPVNGAASYNVYRGTSNVSGFSTLLDNVSGTEYVDAAPEPGQTHWYWVKAVNACGTSGYSQNLSATPPSVPAAPANVSATDATFCGGIRVTWSASAGATRYDVYRSTATEGGAPALAGSVTAPTTLFTDTFAGPGSSFVYTVVAANGCGESQPSAADAGEGAGVARFTGSSGAAIVDRGDPVTLGITAESGLSVTYRWLKDGETVTDGGRFSGATTPTLSITSATLADAAAYEVVVTNPCGPAVSPALILAVREGCAGDLNGDGRLDLLDLFEYLTKWFAGC